MQMLTLPPTVVQDQRRGDRIRFLLYCHDTFGLGHLRRVLSLAKYFTDTLPNAEVLIVTGSPMAHAFVLPPRTDYVKLPAVTKMRDGGYRARDLDLELAAIRDLRATILRDTAQSYRPDVFLADHAPQGFQGEVLPTLKLLRDTQPDCLRVVGLRDIVDTSTTVRQRWQDEGIYQTLEEDYDLILVYGSRYLYDVAAEYALPANVAGRVRYCGYLNRLPDPRPSNDSIHAEHSTTERLVVLTVGGGGDGFPLMRAYLSGLQQLPSIPFSSVILTGPLMDKDDEQELHKLQAGLPAGRLRVDKFLADPLPLLRAADLVVAMAGYNTTCELLALQQRMLLVPRSTPRQEQLIRASLLAQRGLAEVLTMEELTPARLIDRILQSFAKPRPERRQLDKAGISFQGQALARQAILDERDRLSAPMWIGDRVMAQAA